MNTLISVFVVLDICKRIPNNKLTNNEFVKKNMKILGVGGGDQPGYMAMI